MNILELAILKKMVGGGGGSGTDNYNDLSNLPQINGETLAGNKTAENLGLQDALTFDSAPTEDSTNPVESGGVYNALAGKQDNLTFDDDPTENSTNPVKSGGVYNALAGKQDNLTFDGVYNASTNKAATESTVTNAIAGLDVSALSVDADETISSISETDGKISVTKQNIAIASSQVVSMAGYTKPSSAPATPAIQTSDTANQAFGKLEFKADTNQTNILYGLNTGVKNIIDFSTGQITPSIETRGVTWTISENKGVVANGTSESTGSYPIFCKMTLPVGTYKISGGTSRIKVQVDATIDSGSGATLTVTSNTSQPINFAVVAIGNTTFSNETVYPMVCTEEAWNQSHDYRPPALPNYDLTYLQAQDRAALAEVVDSGAKNVARENNITYTGTNTAPAAECYCNSITGSIHVHIDKIQSTDTDSTLCYYRIIYNDDTYNEGNFNRDSVIDIDIYTNKVVKKIAIYPSSNAPKSIGDTVTITNIMVCTKAAFGVSKAFVPYRPNYDLVCDSLFPTSYTPITAASEIASKISNIIGGYAKIGKLVLINIRFTVTDTITTANLFTAPLAIRPSLVEGQAFGVGSIMNVNSNETIPLAITTRNGETSIGLSVSNPTVSPINIGAGTYCICITYLGV